ncbi:MAG: hypothetical protein LBP40_02500 [Campylobacteraceae bacterium]|jgi:hypothetical protein|nr:hypothetical protein [Campylobacteraceae bacterium]
MATYGGNFFKEGNDIMAIAQDYNGKVWFMKRKQKMSKNKLLHPDVFFDSLFEKYGRPRHLV